VFPEELSKRNDCFYVAHLLYPKRIPYSTRNLVMITYQRVLNHESGKFPKEYFSGAEGQLRACICLQYLLIEHLSFTSIEEIYYYFSTTKAMSMLRQFRLATVCSELYESPLDFLHNALPSSQKNELYYQFYRFQSALKNEKLKSIVGRIIGN
jgi:hypothetical protein